MTPEEYDEVVKNVWATADTRECPSCNGSGVVKFDPIDNPPFSVACEACNGHGVLYARSRTEQKGESAWRRLILG